MSHFTASLRSLGVLCASAVNISSSPRSPQRRRARETTQRVETRPLSELPSACRIAHFVIVLVRFKVH